MVEAEVICGNLFDDDMTTCYIPLHRYEVYLKDMNNKTHTVEVTGSETLAEFKVTAGKTLRMTVEKMVNERGRTLTDQNKTLTDLGVNRTHNKLWCHGSLYGG